MPDESPPNFGVVVEKIAGLDRTVREGFADIKRSIGRLDERVSTLELWSAQMKAREEARIEAEERHRAETERRRHELERAAVDAARPLIPLVAKVLGALLALVLAAIAGPEVLPK